MKKRLVVFLTIVLCVVFSFAGCGNKSNNEANANKGNAGAADKNNSGDKDDSNENNNSSDNADAQEETQEESKDAEIIRGEKPNSNPATAVNRKDTLVYGWQKGAEGKFNPIYSGTVYDSEVCDIVFGEGLVGNDAQGLPVPRLAERWEVSEDGRTYTFYMKKGVKFHNGDEVTAEDMAFTYTAICDPSYDGSRMDAVSDYVGYEEYNEGEATSVEGIKVIDDYTISFTLKEVKAPAIYDFGYAPLNKEYYGFEKGDFAKCKELSLEPMGAGPYKFVSYNPGQDVNFERFDDYYKGTPKIERIVFKTVTPEVTIQELSSGGIDMTTVSAQPKKIEQLKDAGFVDMHLYPDNYYGYIGLNLRNEVLADKNVRQAMMYGLNRQGIVDSYYKGFGGVQNSPISPVSWANTDELNEYKFNPEKSKELLEASGWKVGDDGFRYKDGKKLSFSWKTSADSEFSQLLAKVMVDNFKDIGLEVVPELMEFGTLCTQVYDEQDFEMYNMAWSLSIDPDPRGIFGEDQVELGGFNSVGWVDAKSTELMNKGLVETNQEKRIEIYKEWAKLANEELPYLYISNRKDIMAVNTRVKNVEFGTYINWATYVENIELK